MDSNISTSFILWASSALVAVGVGFFVHPVLNKFLDIIAKGLSSLFHKRRLESINDDDFELTYINSSSSFLSRALESKSLWILIGLLLAIALWNRLSSPVVFALVYVIGASYKVDRSIISSARLDSQIDQLVSSFRSRVVASPSISHTLEALVSGLPHGQLKNATEKVSRLLKTNKSFRQSFYPWLLFNHPMLSRFAFLLSSAGDLSPAFLNDILGAFQKNQQAWMLIREHTRQGVNSVVILMKCLLTFTAGMLAAVMFLPAWRNILLTNPVFYTGFLLSLTVLVGYAAILQVEIRRLEES